MNNQLVEVCLDDQLDLIAMVTSVELEESRNGLAPALFPRF